MPTIDLDALTKPVSDEDPCGPDLDMEGDPVYMNFVAGGEGLLPTSYFSGKDAEGVVGRPFDRTSIDLEAQFQTAEPLLVKTRDLRLLSLLARFSILTRNLIGFIMLVRGIATLLSDRWDQVHPRSEDGDLSFRMVAVESLDSQSTVVMPLQFVPLVESRRFGAISYRSYVIAKGEAAPREGEDVVDLSTVEKALDDSDLPGLVEKHRAFADLQAVLNRICQTWNEKQVSGPGVSLNNVLTITDRILSLLQSIITKRDPTAAVGAHADDAHDANQQPLVAAAGLPGRITSSSAAAAALAAIAAYFVRFEPSSPALLLVSQARRLLGKSFLEVMQVLIPDQVQQAKINLGREQFLDVPLERLAAGATESQSDPAHWGQSAEDLQFNPSSRAEALELLAQVGAYFRSAEPSSPIPFFVERAGELAQRDFLSLLKAVLPPDVFKQR